MHTTIASPVKKKHEDGEVTDSPTYMTVTITCQASQEYTLSWRLALETGIDCSLNFKLRDAKKPLRFKLILVTSLLWSSMREFGPLANGS
jgi:hypothetical protein